MILAQAPWSPFLCGHENRTADLYHHPGKVQGETGSLYGRSALHEPREPARCVRQHAKGPPALRF